MGVGVGVGVGVFVGVGDGVGVGVGVNVAVGVGVGTGVGVAAGNGVGVGCVREPDRRRVRAVTVGVAVGTDMWKDCVAMSLMTCAPAVTATDTVAVAPGTRSLNTTAVVPSGTCWTCRGPAPSTITVNCAVDRWCEGGCCTRGSQATFNSPGRSVRRIYRPDSNGRRRWAGQPVYAASNASRPAVAPPPPHNPEGQSRPQTNAQDHLHRFASGTSRGPVPLAPGPCPACVDFDREPWMAMATRG